LVASDLSRAEMAKAESRELIQEQNGESGKVKSTKEQLEIRKVENRNQEAKS